MHRTRRRIRFGKLAAIVMFALLASLIGAAGLSAHELPRERTLLLQVSEDRVEAMIVYLEPPGPAVDLLLGRYDWSGDGELLGAEATLAGREWLERSLYGLQFEVVDESPVPREPDIKFRREANGALSAAVYARWDLPDLDDETTRSVHVRLLREPENIPTELAVRPGAGVEMAGVDLPRRFAGAPRLPILRPGEQATVHVRLKPPVLPDDD